MIILYDISCTRHNTAWSPSTWKTRYVLNYKGLSYRTEWVEFADIEALSIKHGFAPSGKRADGSPRYTLPAIYDESTGAKIADSSLIADYLEATYLDTPSLYPHNTRALQAAYEAAVLAHLDAIHQFTAPYLMTKKYFTPKTEEYYRKFREPAFGGKRLEDLLPFGAERVKQWERLKNDIGKIAAWYDKNDRKGSFLLGETPSWADFVAASFLVWLRVIWGEESEEWKDLETWHNGRWKKLFAAVKKYEAMA
ncbi:hypothetical protein NLJ89_g3986 [Agrocybe chaxingu]|uniref:GST N-terminal domain-containing protein n=1 Tax=Agrocybe chaxingu TaxID=84603 RepID=A0A9W8K992_9AGAR|nr:hypothetical protein NLJ89_g3986 [Agrocybe chaxingu]